MKQVIFLCLLSLTLCLSKPAEPEVPANHAPAKLGDAKPEKTNEQTPVPVNTSVLPAETPAAPVLIQTTLKPAPAQQAQSQPQPPQAETQKPSTMAPTDSNKTTEKKDDPAKPKSTEVPKVDPTATIPAHTEQKPAPTNEVKPDDKGAKPVTTTPAPASPKPTDASKADEAKTNATPKDEDKHIVQARGFDGPSFMGGIILSLGLLAIGFMGFKYYKNQTERNYHTL